MPRSATATTAVPGHVAGSLCGAAMSSKASTTVGFERRFNPALQGELADFLDAGSARSRRGRRHGTDRRAEPRDAARGAAAAPPAESVPAEASCSTSARPTCSLRDTIRARSGSRSRAELRDEGGVRAAGASCRSPRLGRGERFARRGASTPSRCSRWRVQEGGGSETLEPVSLEELERLLADDEVELLDVREADERDEGLIPGSHHFPIARRARPPRRAAQRPAGRDDLRIRPARGGGRERAPGRGPRRPAGARRRRRRLARPRRRDDLVPPLRRLLAPSRRSGGPARSRLPRRPPRRSSALSATRRRQQSRPHHSCIEHQRPSLTERLDDDQRSEQRRREQLDDIEHARRQPATPDRPRPGDTRVPPSPARARRSSPGCAGTVASSRPRPPLLTPRGSGNRRARAGSGRVRSRPLPPPRRIVTPSASLKVQQRNEEGREERVETERLQVAEPRPDEYADDGAGHQAVYCGMLAPICTRGRRCRLRCSQPPATHRPWHRERRARRRAAVQGRGEREPHREVARVEQDGGGDRGFSAPPAGGTASAPNCAGPENTTINMAFGATSP